MVGGTTNGRDFAPRFAARLETGCTSDATELIYNPETTDIEFVEPAAGGKIMAVITIPVLRPQVGTIRPGTFKHIPVGRKAKVEVIKEDISFPLENIRTKLLDFKADAFDPELDIAGSEVIVCVGAGLKDEESLGRYRELAKLLGMSQTGYSKYETGENDVPVAILEKLADLYHTSVDYLLGRTDVRAPYPPTKRRE